MMRTMMMIHCGSVLALHLIDGPMVADTGFSAPLGLSAAELPRRFWFDHAAHVDFFAAQRLGDARIRLYICGDAMPSLALATL